ncbi:hypothetical protein N7456_007305 [Penicillium angulare]|uniref:Protein kinase domain-containing protein n=1 Tax=Penicillium angulare TaxID=116970 RepID=A0A9W9K824_9EURO|nr:hypothetical protein N7456_007305 [Penicillium angulare]
MGGHFMSLSPLRPSLPYVPGWKFTVQSHLPPPPFTATQRQRGYTGQELEDLWQLGPAEFCAQYPPLLGEMGSEKINLEIIDLLKVKEPCNSQTFTVKVNQGNFPPHSGKVVAKLYDPLYYDDADNWKSPCRIQDEKYSRETHAYSVLSEFQGSRIPYMYGSYSLDIPIENSNKVRTVRLILLEYIPGVDMQTAAPSDFDQETRQEIMKNIIEFESTVFFKDIILQDNHPRNIILPKGDPKRTVLIDFADVAFNRRFEDRYFPHPDFLLPGQYISPLLRWRTKKTAFSNWIDWEWRPWLKAQFAHTSSTITPEIREVFGPSSDSEDSDDSD